MLITNDINVLIKQKDLNSEIEPEISLKEDITAPIAQGDVLGTIKYTIEGIEYTSDLTAAHSVEKDNSLFLIIQLVLIAIILFVIYKLVFTNKKHKKYKSKDNYFSNRL